MILYISVLLLLLLLLRFETSSRRRRRGQVRSCSGMTESATPWPYTAAASANAAVAAASANAAAAAAAAASANIDDDIDRKFVTSKELAEFLRFKIERESPSETRNALLVIAVLITTATYQAVLSPPGGLWQDNGDKENRALGQEAGKVILGTHKFDFRFGIFLACNGAGFYGSLFMIEILTEGFPLRWELYFIILALIGSYDSAMISIIPQGRFSILFTVLSILLPLVIVYAAHKARKARRLSRRGLSGVATLFQNLTSSLTPKLPT